MQDNFVGDIGDFGKYGLLRSLVGLWPAVPQDQRLSLGVVWYVPDTHAVAKTKDNHGQDISYLFNAKTRHRYRNCDPDLFDSLAELVYSDRSLAAIRASHLLGAEVRDEVAFYDKPIPPDSNARMDWQNDAETCIDGRDVVFLDPDKGLATCRMEETRQCHPQRQCSQEHIYWDEVREYAKPTQSVVYFQSFGRRAEQLHEWTRSLRMVLSCGEEWSPWILKIKSKKPCALIIMPASKHAGTINRRVGALLESAWKHHFDSLCRPTDMGRSTR